MGITGTDVAQREADMILLDDNFSTIAVAIQEGRKMFDLMGKFAVYHINLNITMAVVVIIVVCCWMPIPFYGLGATLVNGVTCCFASLVFIVGRAEPPDMKQPPRRKKAGFFVRSTIYAVMVPYVAAASLLCWGCYLVTLKAYVGTYDVFRINSYGYAAQGSTKEGVGFDQFYAYGAQGKTDDLCTYGWTKHNIAWKDPADHAKGIDSDAEVPFEWRRDELPYHCKCDVKHVFDLGGDAYKIIDQWGQPQYNEHDKSKREDVEIDDSDGKTQTVTFPKWLLYPYPVWQDTSYDEGLVGSHFEQAGKTYFDVQKPDDITDFGAFSADLLELVPKKVGAKGTTETDHNDNPIMIWEWKDKKKARNIPNGVCSTFGVMQARAAFAFVFMFAFSFHVLVIASGRAFLFRVSTLSRLRWHFIVFDKKAVTFRSQNFHNRLSRTR